jgi:CzcA family heavy metal efflux pump
MKLRSGGLAVWCINHPVSTVMIALAVVVLGLFSVGRLSVNLLPHIIYPEIRVRILDPGVSATVMEDRVTRQLEEQLAITEDAIGVESTTGEGEALVSLSFGYGKDIDIALRDASTRLDRAKRFLPLTVDPPIIYKRDPSQIPVMEFVVSSQSRDAVSLRTWTDDVFAKFFLNLPGVAAVEVGGGLVREIHVLPDQQRLAGLGLSVDDVINAIRQGNADEPAGRLTLSALEYGGRTAGRLTSIEALAALPLRLRDGDSVRLSEVAQVVDTHEDDRLRVRNNDVPGVKVSIQKQPDANTVNVADVVKARLAWLRSNELVPSDIDVRSVADQSTYVRDAMRNASMAAVSGGLLAMIVVYLFLGNLRRTLIIGTAIPISIMATFIIMALGDLTLNIMTLGGLALGVGMLVDSTIVMLENISRHQQMGEAPVEAGRNASAEVTSAIVASTTTNLAAVLPFLFISGLVGLLFRELIFTISAAIVASLVVALTLVPMLGARVRDTGVGRVRSLVDRVMGVLRERYAVVVAAVLRRPWPVVVAAVFALALPAWVFSSSGSEFLPRVDDGQVRVDITTDPGVSVNEMDRKVKLIEDIIHGQGYVENVFTLVGGFVFGRTEREVANRSSITVQLVPRSARERDVREWVKDFSKAVAKAEIAGVKVRARPAGIRGLRIASSDEEISVRVQGPDLDTLAGIGERISGRLDGIPGLRNIAHSAEEVRQELAIEVDRQRAADLGLTVADVGRALRIALSGETVTDFLDGDRAYPIRVRLPQGELGSPEAVHSILLFGEQADRPAVYLRDVAQARLVPVPGEIKRDNQRRIVEVTGSVGEGYTLGEVSRGVKAALSDFDLPAGYNLYYGGAEQSLRQGERLTGVLLGLALFLVFVVMAVQYESLRNPVVILLCVPFGGVGVAAALWLTGLPLSMPVWLGTIMLAGIVVNNSIVLVEYIEIVRESGARLRDAIMEAARLRLRPILMTTLTTVVGMLPLAFGIGEGAEMLQPLAVTIVGGLLFSMLVSLVLVPAVYLLLHGGGRREAPIPARAG